ncbi:putative cyclin-D7-1 [Actinidia eriantha]|uniref:putative cyclin-D7-1 n=1 Tax=Actinidia eriantha TaxID=165200 RepID=UPI0025858D43|nr:putative cyclin-D7-1 [Actinidia eriantha]
MEQTVDSLLCDEVWLTSPTAANHSHATAKSKSAESDSGCTFYMSKEDCEHAFAICFQKEVTYMPQCGYKDHLQSCGLVLARFRAMQWLLKSQSRLNLSCQTVFNAANYFDRYLSMNQCTGWKYWMVELLAIACLSVASKFGETAHPPLHEIQMEVLDHSFQSSLIQRMELTLLKALGWRLGSITAYSYIELLMCDIDKYSLNSLALGQLTTKVTELLLGTLSDSKFLEFRPGVIAISALRCVIKESLPSTKMSNLTSLSRLIPQHQKDDLIKCYKIMEEKLAHQFHNSIAQRSRYSYCCPPSPVTVLTMEQVEMCNFSVHTPIFKIHGFECLKSSKMKRKREE